MTVTGKTKDRGRASAGSAPDAVYNPTRPARLHPADEPPPLPKPAESDPDGFGTADEDGLRMLAALESLTSLEPDYSVDLAAEASVTIIEVSGAAGLADADVFGDLPVRPQRTPFPREDAPPIRHFPSGYDPFDGAAAFVDEEATVEIVDVPRAIEEGDAPGPRQAPQPASLSERIASVAGRSAGGRFFKALSG